MNEEWLARVIHHLRAIGNDTQQYEVKEAKGALPKSIVETLSAFSNAQGGFVILGISEKNGFVPVEGFDARKMQDALSSACERLTPVVRPDIQVIPFEEKLVLCARINEMHPRDKPCYIAARGMYDSSFIRTGDGDRRMTPYEIDRFMGEHVQPTYDDEPVEGATLDDLDADLLQGFIKRQRELHPRLLGTRSDDEILLDLHVTKRVDDAIVPTLAAIVAMGRFPQKFFPRLNVTFTAYPGTTKTQRVSDNKRFVDSQTILGPIPFMIEDVLAAVARNTRNAAVIEGAFRKDVPDYPPVALREAVANALMHRDYSSAARGSQVQVNLYIDRVEILNPGGLYGDVTIDSLGVSGVSSSRNQFLSNILETTPFPGGGYVVENRGTGYQEIGEQLERANMLPPEPKNSTVSFSLTFDKRKIMRAEQVTSVGHVDEAILDYLATHSSASAKELTDASGLSRSAVSNHIKGLIGAGKIEAMEPPRSPRQRYRLAK